MQQTDAPETSAPVVPRVLVFFDYACQFCYLDWPRFKRLRAEHGAELLLVPYELRPGLPEEGVPIAEVGGHSARVNEHMKRMAKEGGIGLTFPHFVPNTHLAIVLAEYARDLGPEAHEAVHEAISEAYNAHAENIGKRDVLLRIAEDHALDPYDVAQAWGEGRYEERIHQFFHLALALGISATPSALICNELFIGSRPYAVLEESLERCLITPEKIEAAQATERHVRRSAPSEERTEAEGREGDPPSIRH
jgi:predicted DsbA family dithiol-disulfide isomerase